MKKRTNRPRPPSNGDSLLLPVTQSDATSMNNRKSKKRSRKGSGGGGCCMVFVLLLVSVLFVFGVYHYHVSDSNSVKKFAKEKVKDMHEYIKKKHHERQNKNKKDATHKHHDKEVKHKKNADDDVNEMLKEESKERKERMQQEIQNHAVGSQKDLPLYEFESLRFALKHSELVLLYFASSWCPMSTPVTEQLDSLFREVVLPLPSLEENMELQGLMKMNHGISLVYVSSDRSEEELEDNLKENWLPIPFDSPDRNKLKQHFKTCAKIEMEALGLEDREREIPSLIVIAGATHQVVTYEGIKDVKDRGQQAVDYWLGELHGKNSDKSNEEQIDAHGDARNDPIRDEE